MAAMTCSTPALRAAVPSPSLAPRSSANQRVSLVQDLKLKCRKGQTLARSTFSGNSEPFIAQSRTRQWRSPVRGVPVMAVAGASIQFIRGMDEMSVPDVKLTRSRDGTNGTATFVFDEPSVFDSSRELGDITGLYLIDDEGIIQSVDVSAKFVNGKPARIEARHVMRNTKDWDRFMRFMERYAEKNNLGFVKK